jgi:hypothetical protein
MIPPGTATPVPTPRPAICAASAPTPNQAPAMQHLVVEIEPDGTAFVCVPILQLWDLLRALPQNLPAISYHYPTQQAQVRFPGLQPLFAQQLLDAALAPSSAEFPPNGPVAVFPRLRSEGPDARPARALSSPSPTGVAP